MAFLLIDNEAARLNALRDLRLLDTPPSESFDRLTRMASKLLGAPVSTVSLTDGDRQWFKSKVGVELAEIPRHQAPCSYAIESDQVFVVPDLLEDSRFQGSPLAQAGIRFYAGAPLITRSGFGLGTICVVDEKPRMIGDEEERLLRDLAGLVMAQIDIQNMIGRVDAATGRPNEYQFFEDLNEITLAAPEGRRVALLVEFVSSEQASQGLRVLGSSYSEQVIRAAVDRLSRHVGNAVKLYQTGGGRCLCLWDERMTRAGEEMAAFVARLLEEPVLTANIPIVLDPAMGLLRFNLSDQNGPDVLRCLFNAVDDAREGGDILAIYSQTQDEAHARNFAILHDVPNALASKGHFHLAYQPRVKMATGDCIGAEALLRWKHPTLGPLSPGEFVPLIEQTGLVDPMTDWVLKSAIEQVAQWRADGHGPRRVSINISAHNLTAPDFGRRLQKLLKSYDVPADSIEIEFTESTLAFDPTIVSQLAYVRDMGVEIAIDDFGTGYSSLSYLKHLPASILKIDRSFVSNLAFEDRDRRLVRTMIDMGHDLGFDVVAEGIECAQVFELLKSWGCNEAQGYHIARPMPAADLQPWMTRRSVKTQALAS